MAEDSDMEKTESASPKRLEKAREEGDVPRSRELATVTLLLSVVLTMWIMGGQMTHTLKTSMKDGLSLPRELVYDPALLLVTVGSHVMDVLWAFLPMIALVLIVILATPALIGGWLFTSKAFMPKFSKLNPIQGISNLFSKNALMELIKAMAKAILVGLTAYLVVNSQLDTLLSMPLMSLSESLASTAHMILMGMLVIVSALVLIAAIDVPYQLMHYANKLKMTKEEVRQESKESEGNPEIKSRIRQQQREMARRRMMSEVPKADVVITNPTHYAVAIQYKNDSMRAPVVIAKGADAIALKIREVAAEHQVAVLESPKLARALYAHTELGESIPQALYAAVAEVLAYVYQLRNYAKMGGLTPKPPQHIEVPDSLDPHANPALQGLLGAALNAEGAS
jgi:flagellar biosynthesis protein FlhB